MKIIVPIKQILDPRGITFRRDKERMFVNIEEYIIGPGSKAAVEAALRLKETGSAQVIAISVGQPQADDALREALAMGCDAAYLLTDPAFKDADITVTTRILAAAVEKLDGADLIVVGRQSGDTAAGQIGPRLAQAVDYAQITDVYALAVSDGALPATRLWGQGYATEATRALMRYAFDVLGLDCIVAYSHPDNQASIHVAQKVGMKASGRTKPKGIELESVVYKITKKEFQT